MILTWLGSGSCKFLLVWRSIPACLRRAYWESVQGWNGCFLSRHFCYICCSMLTQKNLIALQRQRITLCEESRTNIQRQVSLLLPQTLLSTEKDTAILYWTYRAELTNDPSLGVNQKMNDSEAACCGAEALGLRPVNSDFDIFIRILPYLNNKWREDARKLSRPRHGHVNTKATGSSEAWSIFFSFGGGGGGGVRAQTTVTRPTLRASFEVNLCLISKTNTPLQRPCN